MLFDNQLAISRVSDGSEQYPLTCGKLLERRAEQREGGFLERVGFVKEGLH